MKDINLVSDCAKRQARNHVNRMFSPRCQSSCACARGRDLLNSVRNTAYVIRSYAVHVANVARGELSHMGYAGLDQYSFR